MSKYKSINELKENESFNNYLELFETSNIPISVLAIHGGKIEPGTSEIAYHVALNPLIPAPINKKEIYNIYSFIGNRSNNNNSLHITSNLFDELKCLEICKKSLMTISIHGQKNSEPIIYLGGLDYYCRNIFLKHLLGERFNVSPTTPESIGGLNEKNIVNKNLRNMGIQIEISAGYRRQMFADYDKKVPWRFEITPIFINFVYTLRNAIKECKKTLINE